MKTRLPFRHRLFVGLLALGTLPLAAALVLLALQVRSVDLRGDRSLTLRHTRHDRCPLDDSADEVLKHVARLWGFTVRLEEVDDQATVHRVRKCPM